MQDGLGAVWRGLDFTIEKMSPEGTSMPAALSAAGVNIAMPVWLSVKPTRTCTSWYCTRLNARNAATHGRAPLLARYA